MKTDYKKIDLYVDGIYKASTNAHKTCKSAKISFLLYLKAKGTKFERVQVCFAK